MRYALLSDDNIIENIIEIEPELAGAISAHYLGDNPLGIGDKYPIYPCVLQSELESAKAERISQSKADLETYLAEHPLQWTDGEYYSITAEKQNQLTSKIMAATMAQTLSNDYTLTWNSTGEVCREWELSELIALAFAIDARVTTLVSYQQTQEVAMRNAATLDELNEIAVDYDEVV